MPTYMCSVLISTVLLPAWLWLAVAFVASRWLPGQSTGSGMSLIICLADDQWYRVILCCGYVSCEVRRRRRPPPSCTTTSVTLSGARVSRIRTCLYRLSLIFDVYIICLLSSMYVCMPLVAAGGGDEPPLWTAMAGLSGGSYLYVDVLSSKYSYVYIYVRTLCTYACMYVCIMWRFKQVVTWLSGASHLVYVRQYLVYISCVYILCLYLVSTTCVYYLVSISCVYILCLYVVSISCVYILCLSIVSSSRVHTLCLLSRVHILCLWSRVHIWCLRSRVHSGSRHHCMYSAHFTATLVKSHLGAQRFHGQCT